MYIYIPGWLVTIITCPGVILHEIAHRYFCDRYNVDVYQVVYLSPFSNYSGCVVHAHTTRFRHVFFITMGPLIINSLVFMTFLLPFGTKYKLGTLFAIDECFLVEISYLFVTWIGISAMIHSIPSKTDMEVLNTCPKPSKKSFSIDLALRSIYLVSLIHNDFVGVFIRFLYFVILCLISTSIYVSFFY